MPTKQQINICEWGGGYGALISVACLVQHFVLFSSVQTDDPSAERTLTLISTLLLLVYGLAFIAFLLLALLKSLAITLLIAAVICLILTQIIWVLGGVFSLLVLALVIYTIVLAILVFSKEVPKALKQKRQAEIVEENEWKGKI